MIYKTGVKKDNSMGGMKTMKQNETKSTVKWIEAAVGTFVLGYGLHYLAYFLRARYFTWLDGLGLEEALGHALQYMGHLFFLAIMVLYVLAVRKDRKYLTVLFTDKPGRNLKFAVLGALTGLAMMGICILAASLNGNLTITPAAGISFPLLLLSIVAVILQASIEELESRSLVFGRMRDQGVPMGPAVVISAFYFSYLHAANPGFGWLPLFSIFVVGILYALCYHYFGNLWFVCMAHMMWNFTQDFIFGLPDSGKPAALSFFNSETHGSGFFYDEAFGIEGSWMAILVNIAACVIVVLIGRHMRKKQAAVIE